jgi:hypothetical protein
MRQQGLQLSALDVQCHGRTGTSICEQEFE